MKGYNDVKFRTGHKKFMLYAVYEDPNEEDSRLIQRKQKDFNDLPWGSRCESIGRSQMDWLRSYLGASTQVHTGPFSPHVLPNYLPRKFPGLQIAGDLKTFKMPTVNPAVYPSINPRSQKISTPDEMTDVEYFERKQRQNLATKKSWNKREARKKQISIRLELLENEHTALVDEVAALRAEKYSLYQQLIENGN